MLNRKSRQTFSDHARAFWKIDEPGARQIDRTAAGGTGQGADRELGQAGQRSSHPRRCSYFLLIIMLKKPNKAVCHHSPQMAVFTLFLSLGRGDGILLLEVSLENALGQALAVVQVLHDNTFLQEQDAGGDVGDETEVVAGDEHGGAQLAVLLFDEAGHDNL